MTPLRILVAEDNALIGMLLADMLTGMGHIVCAVEATETETVASAAMHLPDLIIADGRLRGGSGVAAMEQILRRGDVAHIFVTGDPGEIEQRMPGAIILQKPFNEAGLERALRSVTLNDDVVTVQICGASEAQATRSL